MLNNDFHITEKITIKKCVCLFDGTGKRKNVKPRLKNEIIVFKLIRGVWYFITYRIEKH